MPHTVSWATLFSFPVSAESCLVSVGVRRWVPPAFPGSWSSSAGVGAGRTRGTRRRWAALPATPRVLAAWGSGPQQRREAGKLLPDAHCRFSRLCDRTRPGCVFTGTACGPIFSLCGPRLHTHESPHRGGNRERGERVKKEPYARQSCLGSAVRNAKQMFETESVRGRPVDGPKETRVWRPFSLRRASTRVNGRMGEREMQLPAQSEGTRAEW